MRNTARVTLAVSLLALAAGPALAGTIDFEGLGEAAGSAVPTIDNVTFSGLYLDRDDLGGIVDVHGATYSGFGDYFAGGAGNTAAVNFVLGTNGTPSEPLYDDLGSVMTVTALSTLTFTAGPVHHLSFDFLVSPRLVGITVELWNVGDASALSSSSYPRQSPLSSPRRVDISSNAGFDQLRIVTRGQRYDYVALDDIRLGVRAVPLPSSAWMGLGLLASVGIAVQRRRRRAR